MKNAKVIIRSDLIDPDNVRKQDFYIGMMEVCKGIRDYGIRLHQAADAQAEKEADPERAEELRTAGKRAEKICWDIPENFAEALHAVWLIQ